MKTKKHKSKEKARELLNLLSDPAVIVNEKGQILTVNDAFQEITGLSKKEIVDKSFLDVSLLPADSKAILLKNLQRRMQGASVEPYDICFADKTGESRCVEVKGKRTIYAGQPANVVVFHDVSRRRENARRIKEYAERMEALVEEKVKEINESEEQFRVYVENSPVAVFVANAKAEYEYVNEAASKMLGYPREKLQQMSISQVALKNGLSSFVELKAKGKVRLELDLKHKSGQPVPVILNAVKLPDGKLIAFCENIAERVELQKKIEEYTHNLENIVQERTKQLKEANEELLKSQRLAAIGELAGMVGHDLRNPLTGIKNAVYYLKNKGKSCTEAHNKMMLEIIDSSIEHANRIINDLSDYSRKIHLELEERTPCLLLAEALMLVEIPDKVRFVDLTHDEPKMMVDTEKMKRAFVNFIKNAIDAMPEGGTLEVRSRRKRGNVEFTFTDTGTGMSEEVKAKLFSPLFTTKAQGMGFGLAICKRVVEAHGGAITVKSALSKGTKFTVTLPIKPKLEIGGEDEWIKTQESLLSMTT
jgi:PAS domain S-box-containing protein